MARLDPEYGFWIIERDYHKEKSVTDYAVWIVRFPAKWVPDYWELTVSPMQTAYWEHLVQCYGQLDSPVLHEYKAKCSNSILVYMYPITYLTLSKGNGQCHDQKHFTFFMALKLLIPLYCLLQLRAGLFKQAAKQLKPVLCFSDLT